MSPSRDSRYMERRERPWCSKSSVPVSSFYNDRPISTRRSSFLSLSASALARHRANRSMYVQQEMMRRGSFASRFRGSRSMHRRERLECSRSKFPHHPSTATFRSVQVEVAKLVLRCLPWRDQVQRPVCIQKEIAKHILCQES